MRRFATAIGVPLAFLAGITAAMKIGASPADLIDAYAIIK
jgi:hypothetical protein